MTGDYILELYRELHVAEKERHDKLNTQLGLPTAIVTVLCGVLAFYLEKCPADPGQDGLRTMFFYCMVAFLIAIAAAIVSLIFAHYNYQYRYLSDPTKINDYMRNMEAWYVAIQVGDDAAVAQRVERDMRELMAEQYVECAATNRILNSQKAKYLHWTNNAIIAALIVMAISIYPFYKSIKTIEQVHKIQIVEAKKEKPDGK